MLTEQQLASVLATKRRIYTALSEILELTGEFSTSIQRGDFVSVQLFPQLRQEPISQLRGCQTDLMQQCCILPAEDRRELKGLLPGQAPTVSPVAHPLQKQPQRNRTLWTRIVQAGWAASGRLYGKNSFYDSQPQPFLTGAWRPAAAACLSCGRMRAHPK